MNERLISVGPSALRPFLRYARRIDVTPDYAYNDIICYDARVMYILDGAGCITIDGHRYALSAGCLLAWQAGQLYGFGDITADLSLILFNLDFVSDAPKRQLIAPDKPEQFDASKLDETFALTENADRAGVLYDPSAFYAEPYMRELLMEYTTHRIYSDDVSRGLLTVLLSKLCRRLRAGAISDGEKTDELIAYINAHLGEHLTYESLGRVFSYHPCHVNRIVTRVTGMPFHRYLLKLRCELAWHLLCDEGRTVAETAKLCGYSDAMSFAKSFRRQTGMSPTEARRRGR